MLSWSGEQENPAFLPELTAQHATPRTTHAYHTSAENSDVRLQQQNTTEYYDRDCKKSAGTIKTQQEHKMK